MHDEDTDDTRSHRHPGVQVWALFETEFVGLSGKAIKWHTTKLRFDVHTVGCCTPWCSMDTLLSSHLEGLTFILSSSMAP